MSRSSPPTSPSRPDSPKPPVPTPRKKRPQVSPRPKSTPLNPWKSKAFGSVDLHSVPGSVELLVFDPHSDSGGDEPSDLEGLSETESARVNLLPRNRPKALPRPNLSPTEDEPLLTKPATSPQLAKQWPSWDTPSRTKSLDITPEKSNTPTPASRKTPTRKAPLPPVDTVYNVTPGEYTDFLALSPRLLPTYEMSNKATYGRVPSRDPEVVRPEMGRPTRHPPAVPSRPSLENLLKDDLKFSNPGSPTSHCSYPPEFFKKGEGKGQEMVPLNPPPRPPHRQDSEIVTIGDAESVVMRIKRPHDPRIDRSTWRTTWGETGQKRERSCGEATVRKLMLVGNFLIMLGGFGLFCSVAFHEIGITPSLPVTLPPQTAKAFPIIVMIGGASIVILSFVGWIAAMKESQGCLGVFLFLMISLVIFTMGGAIIILSRRAEFFLGNLRVHKGIEYNYGRSKFKSVTWAWDIVQEMAQCCGVKGEGREAWALYAFMKHDQLKGQQCPGGDKGSKPWLVSSPLTRVPVSCCNYTLNRPLNETYDNCPACLYEAFYREDVGRHYKGCQNAVDEIIEANKGNIIVGVILSIIVMGIGIFLAIMVCFFVRKHNASLPKHEEEEFEEEDVQVEEEVSEDSKSLAPRRRRSSLVSDDSYYDERPCVIL